MLCTNSIDSPTSSSASMTVSRPLKTKGRIRHSFRSQSLFFLRSSRCMALIYIFISLLANICFTNGDPQIGNWVSQSATQIRPRTSQYPPVLKVDSYEGYLPESAEVGTTVRVGPSLHAESLQILVEDKDLQPGMSSAIYQYILTGFGAEKFAVDQRGYLFLNSADGLDADKSQSTYILHVLAREVDTDPMRSSDPITLTIHVMDVNDNKPKFAQEVYVTNVSAGIGHGIERTILKVKATDLDVGRFAHLTYRIIDVHGGLASSFRYDSSTNELKAVGPLQPGGRYQITIEAEDGGGLTGRTRIIVYAFQDGIIPSVPSSNANNYAAVAASMLAQQTVSYPMYSQQPITRVYAVPTMTTISPLSQNQLVDRSGTYRSHAINNNEVSTDVETLVERLSEATPPKAVVAMLGDAETREKVYFRIVDGNDDAKFGIEQNTGKVTTEKNLDREETELYTLTIETRSRYPDQLLYHTILQVEVADENDNAPQFLDPQPIFINAKLEDIARSGLNALLGRVLVKDLDKGNNGKITLRVMPPMNNLYSIDDNGDLRINGGINEQHLGEHRINVVATDHGDPPREARGQLIVNIRPSGSWTSSQSVSDGSRPVSSGSSSSSDYDISAPNEIGRNNAAMFSRATLPPRYPGTNVPPFTRIEAFQSLTNTLTVTQPPNVIASSYPAPPRLAPVFDKSPINVVVDENEDGILLDILRATYPNGQQGTITYVMQAGDETLFNIDKETGNLTLIKGLDAESSLNYTIKIGTLEAMESAKFGLEMDPQLAHSTTINVQVVDLNDWIPSFEQDRYEFKVIDRAEPGTAVGQVVAYDEDAQPPNNKLRYQFNKTDGVEQLFNLDPQTGTLKVAAPLLDLSGQNLELLVDVWDEGEPPQGAQTVVAIQVEKSEIPTTTSSSIDDSKQIVTMSSIEALDKTLRFSSKNYTASIYEKSRSPTRVLLLTLVNKPEDTRFIQCAIASGNFRGAFHVPLTPEGDCELRALSELDRESVERYLLNVTVQYGATIDWSLVSIHVLDKNDNAPRFVYPRVNEKKSSGLDLTGYFAVVSSNAPINTHVVTVKAEDIDSGSNSVIRYSLDAQSPDAKYFSIDSAKGEVVTARRMQEIAGKSRKSHYDVRVFACDSPENSSESQCGKAQLFINAISDQHRFVTVIRDARPEQIKEHEEDIAKTIRQFTGLCSLVGIERIMEGEISKPNPAAEGSFIPITKAYWYAANPSNKRLCKRQEFRRLFNSTIRDQIASKLHQLFIIDDIREVSVAETLDESEDGGLLPIDWRGASAVLILISIGVAIVAIIALCALLVFRSRHKRGHKRPTGYPAIYPIPKYNNSNVYLPTINGGLGSHLMSNGAGSMERDNKFYESQMLELPISDDNFTLVNPHNGGIRYGGHRAGSMGLGNHHQSKYNADTDGLGHRFGGTTNTNLSMSLYGTNGGGNGSGVPSNRNGARNGGAVRPMYLGRMHGQLNPEEGDFSVDESTYAFNSQLNGALHNDRRHTPTK
ncbi:cadherin domain-containing protein [Ditylenchus destructor]|nr:cadherin domain-containing protein [Ditylenchus destructor]